MILSHNNPAGRLLLCLSLLCVISAQAIQIDSRKAAQIASNFLNQGPQSEAASVSAAPMKLVDTGMTIDASGQLTSTEAYYVFARQNDTGFVIVSGDDSLSPIVGYSQSNTFDPEHMPDALRAYLSDYARVADAITSGRIQYNPRPTKGGQAVSPLLSQRWDQVTPYNNYAPYDGDEQAPTGCVATAIAQVMKHHNYPPAGRGTAGDHNDEFPSQKIDLGHTYDWNNMIDSYVTWPEPNYTEAQAHAVATLMRDVGYAVNMQYNSFGSGAPPTIIAPAMVRNFNYSTDIKYACRSTYTSQEWINVIRDNMLKSQPVLYGGNNNGSSGHQFVFDGIDADDMVHVNWGWAGYSNGYFDINILAPENLGVGAGDGAYFSNQDMVFDIHPGDPTADNLQWKAPMSVYDYDINSTVDSEGRIMLGSQKGRLKISFTITNTSGWYYENNTMAIGLLLTDGNGAPIGVYGGYRIGALSINNYRNNYCTIDLASLISNGTIGDGKYTVSFVGLPGTKYNSATPDDIIPIAAGDANCFKVTVKNGEAYLDDTSMAYGSSVPPVRILDVKTGKVVYNDVKSINMAFTVKNTGSTVMDDNLRVYMIPEAEDNDAIDFSKYNYGQLWIWLYDGATNTFTCTFTNPPTTPGRYRVRTAYYTRDGFKPTPEDSPCYIEVKELPTDAMLMTSMLSINTLALHRGDQEHIVPEFNYYNPGDAFDTRLELYLRKSGDPDASEVLAGTITAATISAGSNRYSDDMFTSRSLWHEDLGTYDVYLKYRDPSGNMVLFPGDNNLTSVALDETTGPQLLLSSPMVINGGRSVPTTPDYTFDVEFEIMSPTGISIQTDMTDINAFADLRADNLVTIQEMSLHIDNPNLGPGERTKVRAKMIYYDWGIEKEYIGRPLQMWMHYVRSTEGDLTRVRHTDYADSAIFRLTDGTSSIDTIEGDSGKTIVSTTYYDMLGRQVAAPVPGTLYLERTTYSDGTTAVRKIIR